MGWEQNDMTLLNLPPQKFTVMATTRSSSPCLLLTFTSESTQLFFFLWGRSPVQALLLLLLLCLRALSLCSALFFSVRSQLQASSCFSISASHSIGFERLLRKMNGCYARMRATGSSTHKSRSVDYSDLLPFSSETENPRIEHGTGESRETARIRGNSGQNAELGDSGLLGWSPRRGKPEVRLGGESFRAVLSRSCSVASKRLGGRLERQSMGAQCSAVKRAFSMRRSSSVSERYCRIHDQSVTQMDHEEEEDDGLDMTGSVKKMKNKKRGGKIFKACKRFLGL